MRLDGEEMEAMLVGMFLFCRLRLQHQPGLEPLERGVIPGERWPSLVSLTPGSGSPEGVMYGGWFWFRRDLYPFGILSDISHNSLPDRDHFIYIF